MATYDIHVDVVFQALICHLKRNAFSFVHYEIGSTSITCEVNSSMKLKIKHKLYRQSVSIFLFSFLCFNKFPSDLTTCSTSCEYNLKKFFLWININSKNFSFSLF